MSDKTRMEAAAKAAMIRDSANEDWPTQEEIDAPGSGWQHVTPAQLKELYVEECRPALAAADAHDAANGVYRVSLDEAAIERAAAVLAMKSYTTDVRIAFDDYKRVARAVLAAAADVP